MGRAGKSCDESRVILYLLLFFPVTLLLIQEFPACPLFYPVQHCSETDDFVLHIFQSHHFGPFKGQEISEQKYEVVALPKI